MALGLSPDRKLVVTGSLGSRPLICVWDSDSMEVLATTKLGRNTRAVSSIRFSRDGKHFFCTDKHNDSNVYCFLAATATLVAESKCGSDPVFDGETGNNGVFAVATKRGAHFFTLEGNQLDKKRGIFNGHEMTSMITITYSPEDNCFFTGTSKGCIYKWSGNTCIKSFENIHQGSVMALSWASGKLLSSGSRDNKLHICNAEGEVLNSYDIPSYAKSLDLLNSKILVATKCGRMITIDESSKAQKEIMHSHSQGETWGLAIADNGCVYTTADDNQILKFNPKTTKVEAEGVVNTEGGKKHRIGGASTLSVLPPNQHARAVAAKGGHVIIGTNEG